MRLSFPDFLASLSQAAPPAGLPALAQALWWDGNGEWHRAHALIDTAEDRDSARVHAYLHRKEGDLSNARYWYRNAAAIMPAGTLGEEWTMLVKQYVTGS